MLKLTFAPLWLLAPGLLLLDCGEGTPAVGRNSGLDACASNTAGQCGPACDDDADCPSGLYCGPAGTCRADCGMGAGNCAAGETCSANGRCTPPSSTGGSGGSIGFDGSAGASGSSDGGDACAAIELQLGPVTPSVVLLIDQSGSMETSDLEPGVNRWNALKQALRATDGPVATLQSKVRFGMVFYSNDLQLDKPPEDGVCPDLDRGGDPATLMPPALNRFDVFSAYFGPLGTFRNTPTAESFERVAAELAAFTEPGPKFIVLATDGNPDRCENNNEGDPNPQTGGALSRKMVVDAVTAAFTGGITTYVISVGDEVARTHLREVANVGQGFPAADATDRFYLVTTQNALTTAFESIIDGVRDCKLTLNGEIDPARADRGQVILDGQPLPMGDNGWKVIDGKTIELVGTACDTIKTGEHSLSARFPCDAVVKPPL